MRRCTLSILEKRYRYCFAIRSNSLILPRNAHVYLWCKSKLKLKTNTGFHWYPLKITQRIHGKRECAFHATVGGYNLLANIEFLVHIALSNCSPCTVCVEWSKDIYLLARDMRHFHEFILIETIMLATAVTTRSCRLWEFNANTNFVVAMVCMFYLVAWNKLKTYWEMVVSFRPFDRLKSG